jgi:OmpA-OmpF porin, OOP family
MASKKYKLLLMALLLLTSGVFAQTRSGYSVYDSAVIPAKRMPQQNEFWNNSYNFPAKPRNMWEIGGSLGLFTISGDVPAKLVTFPNFEVHVRKAFGYIFSLRLQYLNATGKGMHWLISENYAKNSAWQRGSTGAGYSAAWRSNAGPLTTTRDGGNTIGGGNVDVVYYNYKAKVQDLGLQGIVTLNNIRFHKQKTGIVIYGGGGIGATIYKTMVNAYDDRNGGASYASLFRTVYNANTSGVHKNRKDVLKALKDGMDNTYETPADNHGERRPKIGDNTLKPSGTVLMGVAVRLGKRINLSIEDRWTFVKDDLLDGQRWQEHAYGGPVQTRDFDSYNFASIGLNVNLGAKSVEPLWWLNPLDYAYDEFPNKKVKFPKAECPDNDGDGVCDHLDNEPNTPAGCPVDTHGVTKDTDGDGVPDCKDKQLITPTECQPVDADGIGKCPEPACCTTKPPAKECPCDYPSLAFKGNNSSLSADNKAMLATVAAKMKEHPDCKIVINGYPETSKASQSNCQKRLDAIKNYLVEVGGISADRITTNCEVGGGDSNTVDVKCN